MKQYRNYIFDFYGTLADIWTDETSVIFWHDFACFMRRKGASYNRLGVRKNYLDICHQLERKMQEERKCELVEIDIMEVFRELYARKAIKADNGLLINTAEEFRKLSLKQLVLFEGVPDLLKRLKEEGKKIYLLSNAQAVFTEYEFRQLGIKEMFDGICYSSDAGYKKPSGLFFDYLFENYGLKKDESVMIGNDLTSDIKGALDYGLDCMFIHTAQSGPWNGKVPKGCNHLKKLQNILE